MGCDVTGLCSIQYEENKGNKKIEEIESKEDG